MVAGQGPLADFRVPAPLGARHFGWENLIVSVGDRVHRPTSREMVSMVTIAAARAKPAAHAEPQVNPAG